MPKASTSSASRPALRRNQACRSCRKRKLKCDAARPHCGTCVKQWQALISVPAPVGYAHPAEPQCSYDPVEGLTLAPDVDPMTKIKTLEEEITQLKGRLSERQGLSPHTSPYQHPHRSSGNSHNFSPSVAISDIGSSDIGRPSMHFPQTSVEISNLLVNDDGLAQFRGDTESPEILGMHIGSPSDTFLELLFSGWNPDLPDPPVLNHYVDVFFRCDPSASRILHRPSFLASLLLHPKDPNFPHSAILHAICACASRWTTQSVTVMPDGTRRDRFAEFHAGKTRSYIDKTMASGADIFAVMQTRVAIPLRLNYPGTFSALGSTAPGAYLPPPKDARDLECRRRTWWMTILFDRVASVGGWIHAVDERDLGTELPLRCDDFETERTTSGAPQDISQADFFTRHPPQFTDSFILLIKSVMMFGRVTDFNVRGNLRATVPNKNQNPFFLPGFEELDKLVCADFLGNLPLPYRNSWGLSQAPDGTIDTDLYMVHVIPHAAAITLHNPYLNFHDPQCVSTSRCISAARAIIAAYYMLSATSLDICRLHPFVTIVWYLSAVVQVQLCKYFIEINDVEREAAVWGEINVLRFAMLGYGERSYIGTRQEKLLQGLMREIVRMTAQKQPLEMGVPLYPFSHASLWAPRQSASGAAQEDPAGGMPLPSSPPLEEAQLSPGSISAGLSPGSMSAGLSPGSISTGLSPGSMPTGLSTGNSMSTADQSAWLAHDTFH